MPERQYVAILIHIRLLPPKHKKRRITYRLASVLEMIDDLIPKSESAS